MESIFKSPKQCLLAAVMTGLFAGFCAPVLSADMETLIDKLHEKGVLTEDEHQEMRTEARAERREQALRDAQAEEKANKAKEENQLTGRFREGFSWESADKENSITLMGRIHADYRHFDVDSGSANLARSETGNTFDIRRAYLGVTGKLYNDWTFELTSDLAASTVEYAWVNYKHSDAVQARIGAFKMPFSYEELTSSRLIDFQERSLINGLVPAKELGMSVFGSPTKWMSYAVALSNGAGKMMRETSAVVDNQDVIARVAFNFAELAQIPNTVLHLGLSGSEGTIPTGSATTAALRTEGRGLQFFNTVTFLGIGPVANQKVDRDRTGLELIAARGPFKFQAETLKANFSGTSTGNVEFDRDIKASYAAFSWLVTGESFADVYSLNGGRVIKPASPFKKGSGGWGAFEVGVRLSKFDAGDFTTTNPAGTGVLGNNCNGVGACTNKADSLTVGLKWVPNTNTRVYLNYIKTDFDTPVGGVVENGANTTVSGEKAITLRTAVFF
ncbi:MAG: OprO/OprP family phosphate-selective porin [Burkholderiales bacterium]